MAAICKTLFLRGMGYVASGTCLRSMALKHITLNVIERLNLL